MKPGILVIVGPTASGKKKLTLKAADCFNGEIISADSRKVYRYLDIGTAKPTHEDRTLIPHHLIDIIDPDETFSAGDWVLRASEAVKDIISRGKVPVISGGTGFYLKAFQEGLTETITPDNEVRNKIETLLKEKGSSGLHRFLMKIDPDRAAEINENDAFRIKRALEVYFSTGRTFTEHRNDEKIFGGDYEYFTIGVNLERDLLYERIDERVDKMVTAGLLDEIKEILERGYSRDLISLDTVGYKEWFSYIDGDDSFECCLDLVKRNTRRYAKRQLTWFRKHEGTVWVDPFDGNALEAVFAQAAVWLSEYGYHIKE